ncbi:MAG: DUF2207 domain-containing protein [Oscillospiraceae bacterium]|nr:DUF2207 domain-containing protein [Oscillospiraceae bacterium]
MRKLMKVMLIFTLLLTLTVSAAAATEATHIGAYGTVSPDSSCSMALTVTLRLEQAEKLQFPVPRNATGITVNGSRVRAKTTDTAKMIDLSGILGGMAGEFTLNIHYTIKDVVHTSETGTPELRVPILSGFSYPISQLDFSVTLPGSVSEKPHFSSGYHQSGIEEFLTFSLEGASISGASTQSLKDHETLMLTLPVTKEMFPQREILTPDMAFCNGAMAVCTVLALIYWCLFLRNGLPRGEKQPVGPEGYSAGQLGSVLTLRGADLSMMVFSWAKLGYVQLSRERRGDVLIHKQMEMGNERSDFERQLFRKLFSRRQSINTASNFYAELSMTLARSTPQLPSLIKPRTGSKRPFRILIALVGLFGGVNLGIALSSGAALKWFLTIVLAAISFAGSYLSQRWVEGLLLRDKRRLYLALGCSGAWLLLSVISGATATGIVVLLIQAIGGVMTAFGGRRTEAGKQASSGVMGLRRYLRSVPAEELKYLCENDPGYFFTLAPEALALGMDRAFAKRFKKMRLPECPYLHTPGGTPSTALQWSALLRDTLRKMDETARLMPYRRIVKTVRSLVNR